MSTENHAPIVVYADMAYRPIAWWSTQWTIPVTTIKGWISAGTCPAKKVGGQWMISQLELMNWTAPEEGAVPDNTKPGKTGTAKGKKTNGKIEGRGELRAEEVGREGAARPHDQRIENRWSV